MVSRILFRLFFTVSAILFSSSVFPFYVQNEDVTIKDGKITFKGGIVNDIVFEPYNIEGEKEWKLTGGEKKYEVDKIILTVPENKSSVDKMYGKRFFYFDGETTKEVGFDPEWQLIYGGRPNEFEKFQISDDDSSYYRLKVIDEKTLKWVSPIRRFIDPKSDGDTKIQKKQLGIGRYNWTPDWKYFYAWETGESADDRWFLGCRELNRNRIGSWDDWRVPTMEEIEKLFVFVTADPDHPNHGNPDYGKDQSLIWSRPMILFSGLEQQIDSQLAQYSDTDPDNLYHGLLSDEMLEEWRELIRNRVQMDKKDNREWDHVLFIPEDKGKIDQIDQLDNDTSALFNDVFPDARDPDAMKDFMERDWKVSDIPQNVKSGYVSVFSLKPKVRKSGYNSRKDKIKYRLDGQNEEDKNTFEWYPSFIGDHVPENDVVADNAYTVCVHVEE